MQMSELKSIPKAELELSDIERRKIEVRKDIEKIDTIDKTDKKAIEELHRYLDGKYQGCIAEWGKSMWEYSKDSGFDYYYMSTESMLDNLNQMRPKLEAYALNWNALKKTPTQHSETTSNVNVTVNNEINISLTFQQAREKIQDMTSLTDEETKEVLIKITELEDIIKSSDKKKTKWEKAKSVLIWLADKSFDIGMTFLPLLLNIKGGN